MKSLAPAFLDALQFGAQDIATTRALGEARGKQELYREQTPEVLKALKQSAIIESTESSNRIEGVTAPHDRVEALVLRNSAPRDRPEQEIAGYRDALNLIHDSAREMPFSVNVILQIHKMLYRYQAGSGGRWKMAQNEIVERDDQGRITRVRFTPPSPVATPQLMDGLVAEYKAAVDGGRDPLLLVPLAILDFLCIHPFGDGNGRTARLLTLQLLYHFDYEAGRYVSLERIIEESKETYYQALEASSQGWHDAKHNVFPWVRYFWGVLQRSYSEFEERVAGVRAGRGAKTDMIEAAIDRQVGKFSIKDIEVATPGVTRDWIKIVLRRLRDEGRIINTGRGRGARWIRKDA